MPKGKRCTFTHQDILERIEAGDDTQHKLADHFNCSLPPIQRRVAELEQKGMVRSIREGRFVKLKLMTAEEEERFNQERTEGEKQARRTVFGMWTDPEVLALVAEDKRQMEAGEGIYAGKGEPALVNYSTPDQEELDQEERTLCAAGRDGECYAPDCPQERDGEPAASGRDCPHPSPWFDQGTERLKAALERAAEPAASESAMEIMDAKLTWEESQSFNADLCRLCGLDPANVRSLVVRTGIDDLPRIEVEQYLPGEARLRGPIFSIYEFTPSKPVETRRTDTQGAEQ